MPTYRYLHLDVFTATPFEGNQLAVFPEPHGLDTGLMQTITREMNFSECTFIFPAERGRDRRLRIFTPGNELPIAGHPTIGSTFALALEGVIAPERRDFVFELGVGPTPVTLEWNQSELAFAWMTQPLPEFGPIVEDRSSLAAAIGVRETELVPGLPAQAVSCGLPFLFVPLVSRAAVDSVEIDRRALARCSPGIAEAFVFTTEGEETVYSRMLAPALGIAEDPATGGASGPLGCYLLHHKVVSPEAARTMLSLQGVAMKRPSRIHISIASERDRITGVRVGGQSVLVGRGEVKRC
jgi:trans-2,3-dihydro-3-hydroxyanthranilate isomerase